MKDGPGPGPGMRVRDEIPWKYLEWSYWAGPLEGWGVEGKVSQFCWDQSGQASHCDGAILGWLLEAFLGRGLLADVYPTVPKSGRMVIKPGYLDSSLSSILPTCSMPLGKWLNFSESGECWASTLTITMTMTVGVSTKPSLWDLTCLGRTWRRGQVWRVRERKHLSLAQRPPP